MAKTPFYKNDAGIPGSKKDGPGRLAGKPITKKPVKNPTNKGNGKGKK